MKRLLHKQLTLLVISLIWVVTPASAERIKDVATVAGVRANQLVGYGLVVGLDGTGDRTIQAPFTSQALLNALNQLGVRLPPDTNLQLQNIAAVAVHAELPPFAKPGQTIDVTVSSLANSSSLRGGTLLMTQLKGVNGQVYAIAQGNVVSGGVGETGADGSSVTIGVPSAGYIPNGAMVEVAAPSGFGNSSFLTLNLNRPDFTSAARLSQTINAVLGAGTAEALDPMSVRLVAPPTAAAQTSFLSVIENIEFDLGEEAARVIVNSRTGTVVISKYVRVMPAAVSHGALVVRITEDFDVSQPDAPYQINPQGQTVVTPESQVEIEETGVAGGEMFLFPAGVDLNDIITAVNQVGASPADIYAILAALRAAGALRAELIVI
ncbi:MAG: flagellar basal body P-ring protein FlgI [Gammaproteobacteria bacterium]|jgi:flagellar P-ring protein precursor FlgI|nr:flagellar basal body P-ring protein FlgI [Gammaproteobacteria bacterium]